MPPLKEDGIALMDGIEPTKARADDDADFVGVFFIN
jgi:hypothetical protein